MGIGGGGSSDDGGGGGDGLEWAWAMSIICARIQNLLAIQPFLRMVLLRVERESVAAAGILTYP